MRHSRLLKISKQFCVRCNKDQYVTIIPRKKFKMYHCEVCFDEICRVGDAGAKKSQKKVSGGIDVRSLPEAFFDGKSWEEMACERPDVLSDEHTLWPVQSDDLSKNVLALAFKLGYSRLTPRQRQIVTAIDKAVTQENAARLLGVSRGTITSTLKQIQKKLMKSIYNAETSGEIGKGT